MAKDIKDTMTVDLDDTPIDRAIHAVRCYQKGTANFRHVRQALQGLSAEELVVVSIGTRVPTSQLQVLKG